MPRCSPAGPTVAATDSLCLDKLHFLKSPQDEVLDSLLQCQDGVQTLLHG